MSAKQTLVVFGATGNQGGSVINHILADPDAAAKFHIRAVTRDVTKPKAEALKSKGVEVVAADLDDKESLKKALEGADAVYLVTDYWNSLSYDKEVAQGKLVADVAKETGVKHIVYSSLFNIKKLSGGKLPNVFHFDSKAEVEDYIRSLGIPATFFFPGLYTGNFPGAIIRPTESGEFGFHLPGPDSSVFPIFDPATDTGLWVKPILLNRDSLLGKRVLGASEYITAKEAVAQFKEVTGKDIKFVQVDENTYKQGVAYAFKGAPEFVQQELYENMQLLHTFGYYGGESLDESLALIKGEKAVTFKDWVKKQYVDSESK